jgi:hypothetical protein
MEACDYTGRVAQFASSVVREDLGEVRTCPCEILLDLAQITKHARQK